VLPHHVERLREQLRLELVSEVRGLADEIKQLRSRSSAKEEQADSSPEGEARYRRGNDYVVHHLECLKSGSNRYLNRFHSGRTVFESSRFMYSSILYCSTYEYISYTVYLYSSILYYTVHTFTAYVCND